MKTLSMKECILDFFCVEPGSGVGKRVGEKLYDALKGFDISTKVHATVTDSGSDAVASGYCTISLDWP